MKKDEKAMTEFKRAAKFGKITKAWDLEEYQKEQEQIREQARKEQEKEIRQGKEQEQIDDFAEKMASKTEEQLESQVRDETEKVLKKAFDIVVKSGIGSAEALQALENLYIVLAISFIGINQFDPNKVLPLMFANIKTAVVEGVENFHLVGEAAIRATEQKEKYKM